MEDAAENSVKTTTENSAVIAAKKPVAKRAVAQKTIRQLPKTFTEEKIKPEVIAAAEEIPSETIAAAGEFKEPELAIAEKKDKKNKKPAKRRTLCKLVKKGYLEDHFSEYKELVTGSLWICKKCGRTANDAKLLCKPRPFSA